jgi:AcrR family transcriptional regulator
LVDGLIDGLISGPTYDEAMAEGLRERKKRETRQRISDIATGLFLEHGFVTVTIAEVAEAADVSVNTVYNYFPTKEDLFFDRSVGVVEQLSRWVRSRDEGESAAAAVLRELRAEVEAVSPRVGLMEGYDRFMRVIHEAPPLRSRLWSLQQEIRDHLEATLREEVGAPVGDPLPGLIAGQIAWIHQTVFVAIGRRMVEGGNPDEVSREALVLLDDIEELLSENVLNYAVRGTE